MSRRNLLGVAIVALCATCIAIPAGALAGDTTKEASVRVRVTTDTDSDESPIVKIELSEDDHAWLGVGINDLDKAERSKLGVPRTYVVHVNNVHEGSPADEAGIEVGDIIISVNGKEAGDTGELIEMIRKVEPFTKVDVLLYRDGSEIKKSAVLGIRPRKYVWTSDDMNDFTIDLEGLEGLAALGELGDLFVPRFDVGYAWGGKGRLGVYVDDLGEGLAEYFEVPGGKGVLVEEIVGGGAAEEAGIHAGDVIIEIDGESVGDTGELSRAIGRMQGDVPTPIVIVRSGETITVEATVKKADERVARFPGRGVYIYDDEKAKALIEAYGDQAELKKEILEERMKELQETLEELREELEEIREDTE